MNTVLTCLFSTSENVRKHPEDVRFKSTKDRKSAISQIKLLMSFLPTELKFYVGNLESKNLCGFGMRAIDAFHYCTLILPLALRGKLKEKGEKLFYNLAAVVKLEWSSSLDQPQLATLEKLCAQLYKNIEAYLGIINCTFQVHRNAHIKSSIEYNGTLRNNTTYSFERSYKGFKSWVNGSRWLEKQLSESNDLRFSVEILKCKFPELFVWETDIGENMDSMLHYLDNESNGYLEGRVDLNSKLASESRQWIEQYCAWKKIKYDSMAIFTKLTKMGRLYYSNLSASNTRYASFENADKINTVGTLEYFFTLTYRAKVKTFVVANMFNWLPNSLILPEPFGTIRVVTLAPSRLAALETSSLIANVFLVPCPKITALPGDSFRKDAYFVIPI